MCFDCKALHLESQPFHKSDIKLYLLNYFTLLMLTSVPKIMYIL